MACSIDVARARQETPGCEQVTHFNNAGAALMPAPVLDAVSGHLALEAEIGGYEAAEQQAEALEAFYDTAAGLLNCAPGEIAFVENATRAWDMAFYAIPFAPGDRILTGQASYASNYLAFLQMARRRGVVVEVVPSDALGQINVDALRNMIDKRVRLIALTHVPTNGGLVNPATAVGNVAREASVLYLLDACQSVGQMPVDVRVIGCDMLSVTGRKFLRGPRGTGFLYVRQNVLEQLEPPFVDLRAATWVARNRYELKPDARRFENWEQNVAGKLGLTVAIDYARQWGLNAIWQRNRQLADLLRTTLCEIKGVAVHDLGQVRGSIVTFTLAGKTPGEVKTALRQQGINVSVTGESSTRLDMEARGLKEMVRASVHYYNTEAEIERLCSAVAALQVAAQNEGRDEE